MLFALSHAAFLKLNKNFHCPRRVAGEEAMEIGRKKTLPGKDLNNAAAF